jgi:4-amino-4-deoxy-L-arabinose transferase
LLKFKTKILLLLAIIVTGFLLRAFLCTDDYLHPWDERYHALVAKHLMSDFSEPTLYPKPLLNFGNTDWRYSHIWLHKQPLPLWSISSSLYLFGTNEFFVRLPSLILSTLSLLLTFLIGKNLFNDKVGLLACLLQAINGFVIEITSGRIATDHIDVFFMFFIQLSIWFVIKFYQSNRIVYLILIGIGIGLAVLCKWLPAFIVIPLFWILLKNKISDINKIKYTGLICFTSLIIFLPWQIYIGYNYPTQAKVEQLNNLQHFIFPLDGQTGNLFYYLNKIRTNYHDLIYIPLIWLIYKGIKHKDYKKIFLICWIVIPIVFFSISQTKMQGYILFIAPALFISIAAFLYVVYKLKKVHILLKQSLLFLFFLISVIYCVDRVFIKNYNQDRDRIVSLKRNKVVLNNQKVVVFNCEHYVEAMFYYNCTAYDFMPSLQEITQLKTKQYNLYYFENKDYSKLKKIN